MPSAAERQILLAPDVVARAAAPLAGDREQQWMLRQPRAVRESFAEEVFGREDEERLQEIWMLQQPLALRQSYLDEVLAYAPDTPREMVWMLRQSDEVCRSYARFVLLGENA
jgi:IS1 family transposase